MPSDLVNSLKNLAICTSELFVLDEFCVIFVDDQHDASNLTKVVDDKRAYYRYLPFDEIIGDGKSAFIDKLPQEWVLKNQNKLDELLSMENVFYLPTDYVLFNLVPLSHIFEIFIGESMTKLHNL